MNVSDFPVKQCFKNSMVNKILLIESTHPRHLEWNNEQFPSKMTIVWPVAEGRPGDVLLAVAEHAHPPASERLLPIVNDVPRVMEEGGALIQLQVDDALVRDVGDVEPVRGVVIPATYIYIRGHPPF